ncbi:MAG: hypothetical protein JWM64_1146 [Frankiales bacterium]|nr:hypothetical protein [Frankiales bacterium]
MGPDLDSPGTAERTRCPGCSAAVRPDAPWCTQCYADLRAPAPALLPVQTPAPAVLSVQAPAPASSPAAPVALRAPAPAPSPAAPVSPAAPGACWPCSTCGAANGLDRDTCAACGAGFLSALRATEEPLLVLPVVGDLGAMSRAQRLGLAAAVVVAVLLLTALLGLLLS